MNRHTVRAFMAVAIIAATSACGEYYGVEPEHTGQAPNVTFGLNRTEICLMEGDTYTLTTLFNPDTVQGKALYWQTGNLLVATVDNGSVTARHQGTTTISATAIDHQLQASCLVAVLPRWHDFDARQYAYDMVVYANVTVKGRPMDADVVLAAFVGDEVRGLGQLQQAGDQPYTVIRIYSSDGSEQPVTFRLYDRHDLAVYDLPNTYTFDGETHGTLSALVPMTIE